MEALQRAGSDDLSLFEKELFLQEPLPKDFARSEYREDNHDFEPQNSSHAGGETSTTTTRIVVETSSQL